jgi:hypothetical protein
MFDIDSQCWECIQESSDDTTSNNDRQYLGAVDGGAGLFGNSSGLGLEERSSSSAAAAAVRGPVPSRRFGYVSVVHNDKLILFGGFDGSRWLNDMYEFDFTTRSWREIQPRGALPSVRSCPAWAKDDSFVYIQGGYDGVERKSDFFACDLQTYTWTEMPCLGMNPSPRYFHSCCLYGSKMYLYGGYSGEERLADMYCYDFDTNHWNRVDCTNGDAPSGRSSLVAQVYENSLYVFGGYNGATVLNDFYKFRLKPVSVPPPALVQDMTTLLHSPDLSDVTFLVEGKEVLANRAILAVRSEYFRVMLYNGGMKESTQNDAPIELTSVSHDVFLKVLEFLYTDNVRGVTLDIGIPLLIASEHFMLDRLKGLCEEHIRRVVNVENVIGILMASHRHNATGLKDIALDFILRNLNEPNIMIGLSDLKSEPDLLVEIIQRNSTVLQQQQQQIPAAADAGGDLPPGIGRFMAGR